MAAVSGISFLNIHQATLRSTLQTSIHIYLFSIALTAHSKSFFAPKKSFLKGLSVYACVCFSLRCLFLF